MPDNCGGYNHKFETFFIPESDWFLFTGKSVCQPYFLHRWEFMLDQVVYVCSRCKPQPQGHFDAKAPSVADNDTDDFYSKLDILASYLGIFIAHRLQEAAVRGEAEAVLDRDSVTKRYSDEEDTNGTRWRLQPNCRRLLSPRHFCALAVQ